MKLIILITTIIFCLACKQENLIEVDYCKMLAEDQSSLDNRENRIKIFEKNFKKILEITKEDGFPKTSYEAAKLDSCKYWAVSITLIHIAQTKPELLFSKETASIFKEEMDKGNLNKDLLMIPINFSSPFGEYEEDLKKQIEYSRDLWGI